MWYSQIRIAAIQAKYWTLLSLVLTFVTFQTIKYRSSYLNVRIKFTPTGTFNAFFLLSSFLYLWICFSSGGLNSSNVDDEYSFRIAVILFYFFFFLQHFSCSKVNSCSTQTLKQTLKLENSENIMMVKILWVSEFVIFEYLYRPFKIKISKLVSEIFDPNIWKWK
jgi:hypothetical protein